MHSCDPVGPASPSRRALLAAALGLGAGTLLAGCGPGADDAASGPDPLAPPTPLRTVAPGSPATRVVTLSSVDLDAVAALGRTPVAAWAAGGTGPRPWRRSAAPPAPERDDDRVGPPSPAALLPFAPQAVALAGADVSEAEMRGYEAVCAVVASAEGWPGWRRHLELVAGALGADAGDTVEVTTTALNAWAQARRRAGIGRIALALAPRGSSDPVATLPASSPLGREVAGLGFDVLARDEPVEARSLAGRGTLVLWADPADDDVATAASGPGALSLPWLLDRLIAGGRTGGR